MSPATPPTRCSARSGVAARTIRTPGRSVTRRPCARVSDIGARDVVEGMLAGQMVATHEAAMECFRRAALAEQTLAGREMSLKYADKLARILRGTDRRAQPAPGQGPAGGAGRARDGAGRGPGDRRRRQPGGGGGTSEREDRAHAQAALAHAPEPALRCPDAQGSPCRSPAVQDRKRCRMHGGAKGSGARPVTNALKHGRYTRELLEFQRMSASCCARVLRSSSWPEQVVARTRAARPGRVKARPTAHPDRAGWKEQAAACDSDVPRTPG